MDATALWQRYQTHLCKCPSVGMSLDISRMDFDDDFFACMAPKMDRAYHAMAELEAGAIANPAEQRMVGHYWLRAPELAPKTSLTNQITREIAKIKKFAKRVHDGKLKPPRDDAGVGGGGGGGGKPFTDVLLIGIGGSALGPQLIAGALGTARDRMTLHFFDNTDPDGFANTLAMLGDKLASTLVLVVSKSGGTPETRNGMLEAERAFTNVGLDFAGHAVAVTGAGSKLDNHAKAGKWLARFPMWDWVGGRTSVMATVGLLPAALQGLDIDGLLAGAAAMDKLTRVADTARNPAARLALMWYHATGGRGEKDMVILPYKDRLSLMSRYLQQLVMESLGKRTDDQGRVVNQGIAVYGNKGSTDQHAYVQQLREGLNNFFATFIVVKRDGFARTRIDATEVEPSHTSGDFLQGFYLGTRQALYEAGRSSMTITLDRIDAKSVGGLIALYERAVGFYATLVRINAYDQPGVEAGKKAAADVLSLKKRAVDTLRKSGRAMTIEQLAKQMGGADVETLHHLLEYLAGNNRAVSRKGGKYRAI